jgi:surface-anchored protein
MKLNCKILALAGLSIVASGANAQTIIYNEHTDIEPEYEGGEIHLGLHNEILGHFEPNEALIYVGSSAKGARPAGSDWDFTGVAAGADIWTLPDVEDPNLPYLGLGLEEWDANDPQWLTYTPTDPRASGAAKWLTLTIKGYEGPGAMSGYALGDTGPVKWFDTANGFDSNDLVLGILGGETHFNWTFSTTGIHKLTVQASLYEDLGGGNSILRTSDDATYYFGVEAVPEPGTLVALAAGLAALKRRRKA